MIKFVIALLGIGIVGAGWYAVYKGTNMKDFFHIPSMSSSTGTTISGSAQFDLQGSTDKITDQAQQGLQRVASGTQQLIQSWQKLFDEKKLQAEKYMQGQRDELKRQAQQKLEDEAKKKIQWVFSGM